MTVEGTRSRSCLVAPRPPGRRGLASLLLAATLAAAACERPAPDAPADSRPARPAPPPASPSPGDEELRERAGRIVAFLRGDAPLEPGLLADTVTLLVAPEGGGERRRVAREELADRSAWRVGRFALVPPDELTEVTTRVGSHLSCMETELGSLYPELARRPHVGVMLEPPTRESCLQTWSTTLVFGGGGPEPRLTAVVYDQWEW